MRRKIFEQVGGFDVDLPVFDWEMWVRILRDTDGEAGAYENRLRSIALGKEA